MKTSELTGAHLDYWVARVEGIPAHHLRILPIQRTPDHHVVYAAQEGGMLTGNGIRVLRYSTDWAQGGPLIEKYQFDLIHGPGGLNDTRWRAYDGVDLYEHGDTPLQAVCRAVVRAVFGDEVDEVAVC